MKSKDLVENFYSYWVNKNLKGLSLIYDKSIIFNDPAFKNLNYDNTLKMWKMIFELGEGKQINAKYKIMKADENLVIVYNEIKYKFGKNKNKVINKIGSTFIIRNNKIIRHTDEFNFQEWFNQAFAIKKVKSKIFYWFVRKISQKSLKKKIKKISIKEV